MGPGRDRYSHSRGFRATEDRVRSGWQRYFFGCHDKKSSSISLVSGLRFSISSQGAAWAGPRSGYRCFVIICRLIMFADGGLCTSAGAPLVTERTGALCVFTQRNQSPRFSSIGGIFDSR